MIQRFSMWSMLIVAVLLACGCRSGDSSAERADRDAAETRVGRLRAGPPADGEGGSVPIRMPAESLAKPSETIRIPVTVDPKTQYLQRFAIYLSDPDGIIDWHTPHVDVPTGNTEFEFEARTRHDAKSGQSAMFRPVNESGDGEAKGALVVAGTAQTADSTQAAARAHAQQSRAGQPAHGLGESVPITPCTKGPYIYAAPEQDIAVWVSLDSVVVGGDQIFSISFLKGKDQIVPPPPAQVKAKAGVASFPVHMRLTPDANGEIVMEVKNPDAPGIGATYTIQILQPVVNP